VFPSLTAALRLRTRILAAWEHEGFRKYFSNTGWLFAGRMVSYAVSFFTVAIVARYLGPDNYGKLSYAQSFIAVFAVFASLGIDTVVYRDLVAHPEKEREILGTAIYAKLFFGVLALAAAVATALFLDGDSILTALIAIVSLTFIFQPLGTINNLIGAKVASRYYGYATILVSFVIAGMKLLLVYLGQGILWFAALVALEAIIYGIYYVAVYILRFEGAPSHWMFSRRTFVRLFLDSWPLFLAGVSGYFYGRIDQVMLQHYLGSASVGVYDAAVRLTEMWAFFPSVIIISLFPAITAAFANDRPLYYRRLRALTLLTLGTTFVISVPIFLLAPFIVHIVFGSAFAATSGVLRIYLWSGIGSALVWLVQSCLVIENRSMQFFVITFSGALANVALNIILIPMAGMAGSAAATLLSYAVMFAVLCLFPENRAGLRATLRARSSSQETAASPAP
jgi:O-antigen/teichoic acid export membrane protein